MSSNFQFQFQYPMSQAQQQQQYSILANTATASPSPAPPVSTPTPAPAPAPTTSAAATPAPAPPQPSSSSTTTTTPFPPVVAPTAASASSSSQPTQPQQQQQQQSRSAAEQARKDRTLAEFMLMLDDYEPLIPTEVTDYYLQRVGFETEDVRLKRLLALAAQKFVSDIAADAFQHARIRTNAASNNRGRAPLGQSSRDKSRTTLTMEDLSAALAEYGINARKPDFYM